MSKYLKIADRALESMTEQPHRGCKIIKPSATPYELNEFDEISPAFADLVAITEMREKGQVPAHYTATTKCRHCGPVPIFEGCPPKVDGCPWCLNRLAGRAIPRP